MNRKARKAQVPRPRGSPLPETLRVSGRKLHGLFCSQCGAVLYVQTHRAAKRTFERDLCPRGCKNRPASLPLQLLRWIQDDYQPPATRAPARKAYAEATGEALE